jgi:hypothetical protein
MDARVRAALGEAVFSAAWQAGRLTFVQLRE